MPRSTWVALIVGGLVAGMATPGFAQTGNANLAVGARVVKNCSITTTAVAFGAYDPAVTNATTSLDGTGTVVVACTKGAGTRISLGRGANASGVTRRMRGAAAVLVYELYKNAGRTMVWRSGAANGLTIPVAPSRAARTFTVYGRVPAGQDVVAGSYTDTVVATINF